MHKDSNALWASRFQVDTSRNHAEDGVDVGSNDGDAGEQVVQIVRLSEAVTQFLELDETADATECGETENGDFGAGENPEHFVSEFGCVLAKKGLIVERIRNCDL